MNENEMNVLDELNKGACMGMDAIHFVLDKVEDENLKQVLNNQYKKYEDITNGNSNNNGNNQGNNNGNGNQYGKK